jgi:lipid-binding SYLF domain-containing protein
MRRIYHPFLALIVIALLSGCLSPEGATVAEKQRAVQDMRSRTLTQLYEIHPSAKEQIDKAEGYGVFSNVGINLIFLSAANGFGVVRDKSTGQETYMKMVSGGLGLGLGAKDFRGVFVFTSRDALESFVTNGWDASAQADAAAKSGEKGGAAAGAIDVAPGIKLYQITENGLALQATIQGTKYWKDDDLS